MGFLLNIEFPDGTFAAGPLKAEEPIPNDFATWHRYVFAEQGTAVVVYHKEPLTKEKEAIAREWSASQIKKWM